MLLHSLVILCFALQSCVAFTASFGVVKAHAKTTLFSAALQSWCNPDLKVLEEISEKAVYGAARPFIWNTIDVGGRMSVIKLDDGSLFVHSPVDLDEALKTALGKIGEVKHVVSPNYEHLKFAKQWIEAYPNAYAYAVPGLMELKPDIKYTHTVGDKLNEPPQWPDEIDYIHCDFEQSPLSREGQPFFSEVLFLHKPTKTLLCTDMYWNYPSDVPLKTKLWKFGMDKVYIPVFQKIMVTDKSEFDRVLSVIEDTWQFDTIVPCHGTIVRKNAKYWFTAHVRRGQVTSDEQ